MALLIENISAGKVIGIGAETILPGESKTVPKTYENNPVLRIYADKGFVRVTGTADSPVSDTDNAAVVPNEANDAEAAESLRKARLASLKGISDEALGKLAEELGIQPAECKDIADMKKKVREALKA